MRFKQVVCLLLFSVALMACNLFSGVPVATPTATIQPTKIPSAIDPRLQAVLPALKAVNIPLRLLPSIEDYPKGSQNTLYITVFSAEANRYDLGITLQPNCAAHLCIQGHLIGEGGETSPYPGTAVALTNNITGYYAAPVCGANCSDGQLSWMEGNVRYTITMRGDNVTLLTKLANASLDMPAINAKN